MRKSLLFAASAALFLIASPSRAQFCPGVSPWVFDDVQATDPFCGYITWMAQNGITLGCGIIDANHRLYCPIDGVNRSQMAAFLNRLGNVRVEAVGTGPGLTGGPITGIGTINLATTQLLPTTACANGQIARWSGSAWACSTDANSGGTVTSVATGTGLAGGPITSSGTLSIATSYQLPQSCTNGQVPKSNGAGGWTCASVATGTGTVTSITAGAGLTGGTITTSGTIAVDPASSTLTGNFFKQGGNAFGALAGGVATLGTTDNNELHLVANNALALRLQPGTGTSPNVVGGHANNGVVAFNDGQTIGGGGRTGTNCLNAITHTNTRTCGNVANADFATVAGGVANTSGGSASVVGGGESNIANAIWSTVAGGVGNVASGQWSAVLGGNDNAASGTGSAVLGGEDNTASAHVSVAAGSNAHADQNQCFVFGGWSTFPSAGPNCLGVSNIVAFMVDHGLSVNYLSARPDGGGNRWVYIGDLVPGRAIDTWGGAYLSDPGTPNSGQWVSVSDVAGKTDFTAIDHQDVLARVAQMPIMRWRYKGEPEWKAHIGPTAQDFWAAFGLGDDDRHIGTIDEGGVALAAIQGLNAKLEAKVAEQAREIQSARAEIAELKSSHATEIAELKRAVEVLLARTSPEGRIASK